MSWQAIVAFLGSVAVFIKDNVSWLAMLFYWHEENEVKTAETEKEKAEYGKEVMGNEVHVLKEYDGMDDTDVIDHFSNGSKPGGGSKPSDPNSKA